MIQNVFNTTVTVKRRLSIGAASRDALNNPIYGTPTSGAGWSTAYSNVPARLALSSKPIDFAKIGERITPSGVVYIPPEYTIQPEDRVLTVDGIEYTVISVVPGYFQGTTLSHWELLIALP